MKIPAQLKTFGFSPACLLRVSGPDAEVFLQGQFSNDLKTINLGQSLYGLWLDRRGKVVGDSHVIRSVAGGNFWIFSVESTGAGLAAHLGEHLIADEVDIFDETAAWRGLALIGPGAGEWLGAEVREGFSFPGRRHSGESWEWIHPAEVVPAVLEAVAGAARLLPEDMERLRIEAAIPSVPRDIGPADLPNEGGLDTQAISYSKGCYLGQEVMARIKSLGRVRRKLVKVSGSDRAPSAPCALWQGQRREGELRTVIGSETGFMGLALVSVTSAVDGARYAFSPEGVPAAEIESGGSWLPDCV
jgi:folate-binding protein YgfZ